MPRQDALQLDESLAHNTSGDVSRAWLVWSGAAETALADASRFCGGPIPCSCLVLGRGGALFRVVRLGGHKVRKARGNVSVVDDAAGVFLYRDSSIAPLLDMRRRFKTVMSVLDAMIRYGISCPICCSHCSMGQDSCCWPLYPVTLDDLGAIQGLDIGEFHRVVSDIHHRLGDFIHAVVVHRRDDAIRGRRNWIREDPLVHPCKWLRLDLVLPAPFLQCQPHPTPGVLADPTRIDEEFRKPWLPYFCRSGQRDASLEEFDREVDGWLRFYLRCICPY